MGNTYYVIITELNNTLLHFSKFSGYAMLVTLLESSFVTIVQIVLILLSETVAEYFSSSLNVSECPNPIE